MTKLQTLQEIERLMLNENTTYLALQLVQKLIHEEALRAGNRGVKGAALVKKLLKLSEKSATKRCIDKDKVGFFKYQNDELFYANAFYAILLKEGALSVPDVDVKESAKEHDKIIALMQRACEKTSFKSSLVFNKEDLKKLTAKVKEHKVEYVQFHEVYVNADYLLTILNVLTVRKNSTVNLKSYSESRLSGDVLHFLIMKNGYEEQSILTSYRFNANSAHGAVLNLFTQEVNRK